MGSGSRGWPTIALMSERTVQLYIKLAKHRAVIEKEMANPQWACGFDLNEAAALCVLAGRIEKLIEFAKRAETSTPDDLIELCTQLGFGVITDDALRPILWAFRNRATRLDIVRLVYRARIRVAFDHVEWIFSARFRTLRNG